MGALLIPLDDPIVRVAVAFVVGESVALVALVGGALMRDRQEGRISHGYIVAKRSVDIAGSLVLLVLLAPVLVIAAIAVRLDSEGPAFFRQIRVGRDGVEFWMVKLRTMAIDHDDEVYHEHLNRIREGVDDDTEYTIRIDDDPRITSVGLRLRRWSLDELPNLWNVLKGSMSPRRTAAPRARRGRDHRTGQPAFHRETGGHRSRSGSREGFDPDG